jgi:hypothetical protein
MISPALLPKKSTITLLNEMLCPFFVTTWPSLSFKLSAFCFKTFARALSNCFLASSAARCTAVPMTTVELLALVEIS